MTRNVTIVVIILVLVVIAGYLVWLRGRFQPPVTPQLEESQVEVTPVPSATPEVSATPSATAAPSATPKAATSGATTR